MIQKYYGEIIEQAYERLGRQVKNTTLAKYSNDLLLSDIVMPQVVGERQDVSFFCHEFEAEKMAGPYEPFLDIIRQMLEQYEEVSLDEFLASNDIYYLHRPILSSYLRDGISEREEALICADVKYEKERMTEGILALLIALSKKKPCVILLNQLQYASKSTIVLINLLLESRETRNIAMVLGVNDLMHIPDHMEAVWEEMTEKLEDRNQVFPLGNAGKTQRGQGATDGGRTDEEVLIKVKNLVQLMDFEQALYYLDRLDRRIKFENLELEEDYRFNLWVQYANAAIFSMDLSRAMEICEDILKITPSFSKDTQMFYYYYLTGNVSMYRGRLLEAVEMAKMSRVYAQRIGDDRNQFLAELLEVQARMSGWFNIFFCAKDIEIRQELLTSLTKYNYKNHLAYIYIYAYDNEPEVVARAAKAESELLYFSRGVALAKEIGNERLVYNAYQKNIMLASTNGMYDISNIYYVRIYEVTKNKNSLETGRVYSGLGYNLSALGRTAEAMEYFKKAIWMFYKLKAPEDIAEVFYNISLNCIQMRRYEEASDYLMLCMKTIEKLQLNSLRVCNISKLYGILALCSAMEKDRFHCERYLHSCKQFLNYVIEKENRDEIGSVHDYAKCDDDMFLYYFSRALLDVLEGKEEQACKNYEIAERHLIRAEGNQFFCYRQFRECRIALLSKLGREEQLRKEREILSQYEKEEQENDSPQYVKMLGTIQLKEKVRRVSVEQVMTLIQQEGIAKAYQLKKEQMDFISVWQKLIDVTDVSAKVMMESVMKTFLYHFGVDKAIYIRYQCEKPQILFDNTGKCLSQEEQSYLAHYFEENTGGFAVSKISSNYSEHLGVVSLFGEDDVCSMVAVPFINHRKTEGILITYVLMKDNWHTSVNRYMMDENDLSLYELLFREVQYSLNRLDAYEKVYEMNAKLYQSAITDQLTGIYNRKGFYLRIEEILAQCKKSGKKQSFALMFIDLDNFKCYNDTFGHDVGDLILKEMAEIFKEVCGREGFVSRYGGDEFILLVKNNRHALLEDKAKQIYQKITAKNGFQVEIEENIKRSISLLDEKKISCSIGIAGSDDVKSEEDINRLVKQADDLLYTIKTTSKGRYTFM